VRGRIDKFGGCAETGRDEAYGRTRGEAVGVERIRRGPGFLLGGGGVLINRGLFLGAHLGWEKA